MQFESYIMNLSKISDAVSDVVTNGLFINPINFIAQLVSTIILFLILKRFVWVPMQEFLKKRSDVIVDELESARALNEEAQVNKEKVDQELKDIRLEASRIINAANHQAEQEKAEILKKAEQEALDAKRKAERDIARERQLAQANIKEQAVDLAFVAAEKLIQANMNSESNKKMIDDFIHELGE